MDFSEISRLFRPPHYPPFNGQQSFDTWRSCRGRRTVTDHTPSPTAPGDTSEFPSLFDEKLRVAAAINQENENDRIREDRCPPAESYPRIRLELSLTSVISHPEAIPPAPVYP